MNFLNYKSFFITIIKVDMKDRVIYAIKVNGVEIAFASNMGTARRMALNFVNLLSKQTEKRSQMN